MKKLFIALVMVLAMTGAALADHNINIATADGGTAGLTVGAVVRTQGIMQELTGVEDADAGSFLDARGRFKFGFTQGDYKAVLQFEIGDLKYDSNGGVNNEDAIAVEVKHLYLQGPLGPLAFTAGLQNIWLGNGITYNDDDWAIAAAYNMGDAGSLSLLFIKENEEGIAAKDDTTLYGIAYTGAFGGFKVAPYFAYAAFDELVGDGNVYYAGLPVSGAFGPVAVKAEVVYQGGEVAEISQSAFAVWANATMMLGAAKVYGEFGMGTGDDDASDDENNTFRNFADDGFTFDLVLEDNNLLGTSGLNNLTYIKVGGNYAMGALNLGAAVILDSFSEAAETAIGTEIDVTAAYKISPNFTLSAAYGMLLVGDAWGDAAEDIYKFYWKAEYAY